MTTTARAASQTVHVEHCMGTVFTIDIRDPGLWDEAIGEAVAWLHHVDAVFSPFKDDSDISRLRREELAIDDADPDVAPVLDLCRRYEVETGGYFSARWDGRLDPSGLVKGWAIERASQLLRGRGSRNHAVNGGGDIQLSGQAAPGQPWTIGISDPFDSTRVLSTVTGRDFAIATSGVAERGAHIVNPHSGEPAVDLASVTVTGPSLTRVDVFATAAFAMGHRARGWIDAVPGHEALVVAADGRSAITGGYRGSGEARRGIPAQRTTPHKGRRPADRSNAAQRRVICRLRVI